MQKERYSFISLEWNGIRIKIGVVLSYVSNLQKLDIHKDLIANGKQEIKMN